MKRTLKLVPVNTWRTRKFEQWLSVKAQDGLYLSKIGTYFAHFTKGNPDQIRYKIEVAPKRFLSEEKKQIEVDQTLITTEEKEIYAKSGWKYITSYDIFYVFSSSGDRITSELNTDPYEQIQTLDYVKTKLRNKLFIHIILFLCLIFFYVVYFSIEKTPYLALISLRTLTSSSLLLAFSVSFLNLLKTSALLRSQKKEFSECYTEYHSDLWGRIRFAGLNVFSILIPLILFFIPLYALIKSKNETLPTTSIGLPIVRLADIEQSPDLVRETEYIENETYDILNCYEYEWSPFAPTHYTSDESGIIANMKWKGGSGIYSPSLSTQTFQLPTPYIKEGVLSDLVRDYNLGKLVEIKNQNFDKLYLYKYDSGCDMIAAKGNGIIYIRYNGCADINTIMKAAEEKIILIS